MKLVYTHYKVEITVQLEMFAQIKFFFSRVKDCIVDMVTFSYHIGGYITPRTLLQYKDSWAW